MNAPAQRQGGAIAIMYALMLPAVLGCVGLALDLGMCYLRRSQLQNAADSIAVGAAQALNGTSAGITAAADRAFRMSLGMRVGLSTELAWNSAALSFASSQDAPESDWLPVQAAGPAAATLRYARVDLNALDESMRHVQPVLMGVLGAGLDPIDLAPVAVAGPTAANITPLAICAMSDNASEIRPNPGHPELIQYGFRFGVGYNLLGLSAAASGTGEYFYVDPMHVAGADTTSFDEAAVAPFMCTGTVGYTAFANGKARLRRPDSFNLWQQLNSRFGTYGGAPACNRSAAPPDTNIRSYAGANASWLTNPPTRLTAKPGTATGKLRTIADDPPPLSTATVPGDYGILWAYGAAKTPTGAAMAAGALGALYPSTPAGSIKSGSAYPTTGVYLSGGYSTAPTGTGRAKRRLLYIPLLRCPVAAGTQVEGDVVAIARFLLTAPASATEVPAEFAGTVTGAALPAAIGLLQ